MFHHDLIGGRGEVRGRGGPSLSWHQEGERKVHAGHKYLAVSHRARKLKKIVLSPSCFKKDRHNRAGFRALSVFWHETTKRGAISA